MTVHVPEAARSGRPARSYGPHESTAAEATKGLTRVALGWFLFHQGWGKVVEEWTGGPGSFYRGGQFQNSVPDWLPTLIAAPYGYALPWVELASGALLALGLWNRIGAGVSTLVFLSILVAWLDAGNLLPRHMLMVYTPLAAWYFFTGPGRFSLDGLLEERRTEARSGSP